MVDKVSAYLAVHGSIYENIRFADTKATAITAVNLAVVGGLYSLDIFNNLAIVSFSIACAAFFALALSIIFSMCVIRPRGNTTANTAVGQLTDPNKIKAISYESFRKRMEQANEYEIINHIGILIYDRSVTNDRKYRWLSCQILSSFAGWALSLTSILVKLLN
ncbi:Pycsar system effector family protein [Halioxenophilus aromaticivorans]|uniref:Pycsar effector protein domain-containing protein n=1 Tax=Halioxenophilus aromaticivorans TaxID=1306992 RepID=A0AAV3U1C3_9ALTE